MSILTIDLIIRGGAPNVFVSLVNVETLLELGHDTKSVVM
jgi:hypothetical protein